MGFKAKPKKTTTYPKLLHEFEKRRNRNWVINKANLNSGFKKPSGLNRFNQGLSRAFLRRFSGNRGK